MKTRQILFLFLFAGTVVFSCKDNRRMDNNNRADSTPMNLRSEYSKPEDQLSASAVKLKTDMRELWEDHVIWTRNVVLNIMDGLPGTDQAVERLLKNQDDIGDAMKPYYGNDAGKKLTDLLHTHITTAAELLKAAKSNNQAEFERQNQLWKDNADQISKFLSDANPNWGYNDIKKMMDRHLELTTQVAVDRQKKDYKADVADFDKVRKEILEMSDMLTVGIIRQFPDKFDNKKMAAK